MSKEHKLEHKLVAINVKLFKKCDEIRSHPIFQLSQFHDYLGMLYSIKDAHRNYLKMLGYPDENMNILKQLDMCLEHLANINLELLNDYGTVTNNDIRDYLEKNS